MGDPARIHAKKIQRTGAQIIKSPTKVAKKKHLSAIDEASIKGCRQAVEKAMSIGEKEAFVGFKLERDGTNYSFCNYGGEWGSGSPTKKARQVILEELREAGYRAWYSDGTEDYSKPLFEWCTPHEYRRQWGMIWSMLLIGLAVLVLIVKG